MARQSAFADSAGLHGARAYAAERLSSVSSVKIAGSKGEVTISVSTKGGRIVSSHTGRGEGNASKDKAVHKK